MKPFDHSFDVAGKKYVLRNSFAARRSFEQRMIREGRKKSVPGMLKRLTDPETQTAEELIDLFMLLLSSQHPDLTADDIVSLIDDMGGEDEAMKLLSEAIAAQMPPAEGTPNPQPRSLMN